MSWISDLVDGVASDLATRGYGTYTPDAVGGTITVGTLPLETTQGIGVQDYDQAPDPVSSDTVVYVQLWLRGTPAWVRDTGQAVIDTYAGAVHKSIGGLAVSLIGLQSDARMGSLADGRVERAINLTYTCTVATAARPE